MGLRACLSTVEPNWFVRVNDEIAGGVGSIDRIELVEAGIETAIEITGGFKVRLSNGVISGEKFESNDITNVGIQWLLVRMLQVSTQHKRKILADGLLLDKPYHWEKENTIISVFDWWNWQIAKQNVQLCRN